MSSFQETIHKKVPVQGPEMSKFMCHWVESSSQAAGVSFVVHL